MKATRIISQTLLGIGARSNDYPISSGNCFSVETDSNKVRRVLNFNVENLHELLRRNIVAWPIEITPHLDNWAYITDPRIPPDWHDTRTCETCIPKELL